VTVTVAALAVVVGTVILVARTAKPHCDAMDGPVVSEAKAALKKGDVTPVLKWVKKEHEDEVRAAFERTRKVRDAGDEAAELADLWFYETLVRLHRAGEGAPYTGLKPAGRDPGPEVRAADNALASGSVDELARRVAEHAAAGIRQRFERAREAQRHMSESVHAGRAYVAAYVEFVHYVKDLHQTIAGGDAHGHGD